MVDLEVACMIFLLKVFVRCFGHETYLFCCFFSWRGETYQKTKKSCQSRQLIWCLLSLEKVRDQQKNEPRQLGCARKVVWWGATSWLLKKWVWKSGITRNWQKSPARWRICFSNYELFRETTTYSSKQSWFGIVDIPNDKYHRSTWSRYDMYSPENQRMSLENQ